MSDEPHDPDEMVMRAPRRYVSSNDVARLAGVSQAAVSRTFTKGASVSARMRAKVMAAAEELGYRPSVIPRIMLTHQSRLIAIVIGGLYNPFHARMLELFARRIQDGGSHVLLFSVGHGEYIDEILPSILGYRADAIISALSIISEEAAASCARMKVPVVLFNNRVNNDWVASVSADNTVGGRDVAALFLARGARRFGFIGGITGSASSDQRLAGYRERLAEAGVHDIRIGQGNFQYDGGFEAARAMLKGPGRIDALFCANDLMAIGALEAARTVHRLEVPRQLMVAGFDDIPSSAWPSIDLTTLRHDGERMVDEATAVMNRMLSGGEPAERPVRLVPAPLVERGSTRRG